MEWLKTEAGLIEKGIQSAPRYTFDGFDAKLCKAAFEQSTLTKEEQEELVGIIHYLDDQKLNVRQRKLDALQEQKTNEQMCTTVARLRTPFFGVINGIFRRDPNVVSKKTKQERTEAAALVLEDAKICVSKHNALILRIEDMIRFYVDGYNQSLKKPADSERDGEEGSRKPSKQNGAEEKLVSMAKYMLIALENQPTSSLSFSGIVSVWNTVDRILVMQKDIKALIDSTPSLKSRYEAPNISDGFKDFADGTKPTSNSLYLHQEQRYDAMIRSGRNQLSVALKLYEEFLKQLGDMEPGPGTTLASSPLLKSCSKLKISQSR